MLFILSPSVNTLLYSVRPTARVTRLGWEGGFAAETEKTQSHEMLKKRGAYPKSGARIVGHALTDQNPYFLPPRLPTR